jgi:hypothetical protein
MALAPGAVRGLCIVRVTDTEILGVVPLITATD